MKKKMWIAAIAALMLSAAVLPATVATATPGKTIRCTNCHTKRKTSISLKVTQSSATTDTVTYKVTTGGKAWAAFVGDTRVAGKKAKTGSFTVPTGTTFTVYGVNKYPYYRAKTITAP